MRTTWYCSVLVGVGLGALALPGCAKSENQKLLNPRVDARLAATRAMDEFDQNHDGFLEAKELAAVPSLRGALARIDSDKDGKISRAELEARLVGFYDRNLAAVSVICKVTESGRPLGGATVTFVPEPFLGEALLPSTAVTDAAGVAIPALQSQSAGGNPVPGVQFGYYRIEVSKPIGGRESLGAPYNRQSKLGQEVAADADNLRGMFAINVGK